jgi:hypothetical protein
MSHPEAEHPHLTASRRGSDRSGPRERPGLAERTVDKDGIPRVSAAELESASPKQRIAELEMELAESREAATRQLQDSEQDAATFRQTIERLAYSERVVRQTTTKLIAADEQLEKAVARNAELSMRVVSFEDERERLAASEKELRHQLELMTTERQAQSEELEAAHEWTTRALAQEKSLRDLAESLSRDLAAGASEGARLQETCLAAEARAEQAIAKAQQAESSSAMLQSKLENREGELRLARKRLQGTDQERERISEIFQRVEALSHEIIEAGLEARALADDQQESDAEYERATLIPGRPASAAPQARRDSAGPMILVDGVELALTNS